MPTPRTTPSPVPLGQSAPAEPVLASIPARVPVPGVLQSSALLGENQSVAIEHLGQIYRLQTTRQGKLILTK